MSCIHSFTGVGEIHPTRTHALIAPSLPPLPPRALPRQHLQRFRRGKFQRDAIFLNCFTQSERSPNAKIQPNSGDQSAAFKQPAQCSGCSRATISTLFLFSNPTDPNILLIKQQIVSKQAGPPKLIPSRPLPSGRSRITATIPSQPKNDFPILVSSLQSALPVSIGYYLNRITIELAGALSVKQ